MYPVAPIGSIGSRIGTEQHRVSRPIHTELAPKSVGDMIDRLLPRRR